MSCMAINLSGLNSCQICIFDPWSGDRIPAEASDVYLPLLGLYTVSLAPILTMFRQISIMPHALEPS